MHSGLLRAEHWKERGRSVPCRFCGKFNVQAFSAEMNIHFQGLENLETPTVWVFPPVTICLNCGRADFMVPVGPLKKLRDQFVRKEPPTEWTARKLE